MSRFAADFPVGKPDELIYAMADDYLQREGFTQKLYKGEIVWKKGKGFVSAPQFIKLIAMNGNVHLEAWIKTAILPGWYVGEMGLDGGWGFAVKGLLKSRVDALVMLLLQPAGAPAQAGIPVPNYPSDGYVQPAACDLSGAAQGAVSYPTPPFPFTNRGPTGVAAASLVFGLMAIVGCFVPSAGIVTGITGIILSAIGRRSAGKGIATAGLVLSIVFLLVSIMNCAAEVYLRINGIL